MAPLRRRAHRPRSRTSATTQAVARRFGRDSIGEIKRLRRREGNPGAAYAAKAGWPPYGETTMHHHGWVLPLIIVTVVVTIKVRVKR
jgi:hypothetical protein